MPQFTLIPDIAVVLAAALLGGMAARRLKLPVILGYLVGGIAIGPFGLGLVHDLATVETLANIGVILLMFALGVQFSFRELKETGRVAVLGGIAQILVTAALGVAVGGLLGWSLLEAIFFGFLIALSSTMILLKTLMERGELGSLHGRIMMGLLIVQDLSVVPMVVILPSLGKPTSGLLPELGIASLKAGLFLLAVFFVGMRLLPWVMARIAGMHSRELFILSIVTLCLGAAFATYYFGLSLALGAFVAGLMVSESDYSHQALADIVPLRDTFAILFFVSVGMLTDPHFILDNLAPLLIVVLTIVFGKFVICSAIVWLFGYTVETALFVGTGMIQIGEFSFVLARAGVEGGVISEHLYALTLAAAIVTILLTPFALNVASGLYYYINRSPRFGRLLATRLDTSLLERGFHLSNHVVICGHGRVGGILARVLERRSFSYLVIDLDPRVISALRARGVPCIYGDAANSEVLSLAGLEKAKVFVITCPDPIVTELASANALRINPKLDVVARVHGNPQLLRRLGVSELVHPEFEASLEIIRHTLRRFGLSSLEIQYLIAGLRQEA